MQAASIKDWLASNRRLPSWVLSGLFHAALVALLLWVMPARELPPVGDTLERSVEIGIFVKERGPLVEPQEGSPDAGAPAASATTTPRDPLSPATAVPESNTIAAPLPQAEILPGIGPGAAVTSGLPDPKQLINGSGGGKGTGKPGAASGGMPGTAFMGIKDSGTRVVYVVDASGSMYQHNSMGQAKGALVASLNALDPGQQFQIIFYNESPQVMSLKNTPKKGMYFATDLNKAAAQQFIQQVDPDLGTEHYAAILLGLSFTPEVMYVLTDSGDPLSPRQLNDIEQRNRGRTRIHCIEFGVGKELTADSSSFLRKLAEQNDGTRRYVDVTQSKRR